MLGTEDRSESSFRALDFRNSFLPERPEGWKEQLEKFVLWKVTRHLNWRKILRGRSPPSLALVTGDECSGGAEQSPRQLRFFSPFEPSHLQRSLGHRKQCLLAPACWFSSLVSTTALPCSHRLTDVNHSRARLLFHFAQGNLAKGKPDTRPGRAVGKPLRATTEWPRAMPSPPGPRRTWVKILQ